MRGTFPALITAVLLTTAWAYSTEASQWRCVTEKKVGVDISDDFRPANLYLGREEFRVMDKESVLELYKVDPSEHLFPQHYDMDFLVRKVWSDPKNHQSWFGLDSNIANVGLEDAKWSSDLTKTFFGSFIFHVESGRFQFMKEGGYAWGGPEEGGDPSFSFGTCRPYYD